MLKHRTITRLAAVGLAAAAIAPAGAAAAPADNGPAVSAGGTTTTQDLRAPDHVDRGTSAPVTSSGAPQWPAHPQTLRPPSRASSGSGDDDTVLVVGLGALALASAGGLGLAYRSRARTANGRSAA